jgi:hypothetical protein
VPFASYIHILRNNKLSAFENEVVKKINTGGDTADGI